jgi:hypothetical protein
MVELRSPVAPRFAKFLTAPVERSSAPTRFWFCLSLTFAAVYGYLGLRIALSGDYVIQGDARQHVFWMQRFIDKSLFPNDLIADYYQSLAPAGYAAFYQFFATIGINPILFSKLLPPVLGLITTAYCFGVTLELLPVPLAGFISSLLMNQTLWMVDDLASATPRAFTYPLFFAFLYYLLRRDVRRSLPWALLPFLISLVLLVLFFPIYALVAAMMLMVLPLQWQAGRLGFYRDRRLYWFCLGGLGICGIGVLWYALSSSQFGPTMSVAEAKTLAEFQPEGQYAFFFKNPIEFWLFGRKGSGYFSRSLFTPVTLLVGLFLPVILRFPVPFHLVRLVKPQIDVLLRLVIAATAMFLLAHLFLFRLYLPNRYTNHSLKIVLWLAAGITFTLILDALLRWFRTQHGWRSLGAMAAVGAIVIALVCYPSFVRRFPNAAYVPGLQPSLYQFLAQQPKDSLVVSLSEESSNVPTFAQRPILVARIYATTFHVGYYHPIRQRIRDLILTQYSPNQEALRTFNQKYGVRFWLVDKDAFSPNYLTQNGWRRQYQPEVAEAISNLQRGDIPALQKATPRCTVFETAAVSLLEVECLNQLK